MDTNVHMPSDDNTLIVKTVAETLFIVSDWVLYSSEIKAIAQRIANNDICDWTCCPLCDEVECDDDCPLYTVRLNAKMW